MKSFIKIASGFLAVVILSAFVSYSIAGFNIDKLKGFSVAERGITTQKLKWKKAENVSGYKIYQKNNNSNDYTLIETVNSENTTEFTVENLDMESFYTFKICPYKNFLGYEKDGELSKPLETFTLPRGESIEKVSEEKLSTLTVSWTCGINCTGYEVEYALNSDFSDAVKVDIPKRTTLSYRAENLQEGKTYHFRIRSYIADENNNKFYSDYSESINATVKAVVADVEIDKSKPVIALTFDDGPDYNGASKRILDVLEKYNIRATFFTLGENAKNNPENIKRKVSLGCEIGNHTYDHSHYGAKVTESDIVKCSDAIQKITGSRPTVFRSTGGMTTQTIRNICKKEGMSIYYWSVDTRDWESRNANKIIKKAMTAKDGDIILMHDIYQSTADAVEKIVPKLLKKGYQFVTVSQLVKLKTDSAPVNGVQYMSGSKVN